MAITVGWGAGPPAGDEPWVVLSIIRLQLNSLPSKERGQDPINGFVNRWGKHSATGRWASQTAAGGRAICKAAASGQGGLQGEVSEGFFVVELFLAGIRPLREVFWKQSPAAKMGIVDSEWFRLRRGGRDRRHVRVDSRAKPQKCAPPKYSLFKEEGPRVIIMSSFGVPPHSELE